MTATLRPEQTNDAVPAVQLQAVSLARAGRIILGDLSLAVHPGEVLAVLGPSGSGKSTLLAAIVGELAPASGQLHVGGQTVPYGQSHALLAFRKQFGVLLQGNGLLTDLTVAENVALPLTAHTRLPPPVLARVVALKLRAVGLSTAADLYPRELSGGMARRVALARALALDPPLMIYDEPLTGLDPIAGGMIVRLIRRLNQTLGLTSLIVTHHVRETLPIADRAMVIAGGRARFVGTPAALAASNDPLLRQFLDGDADGPLNFDDSDDRDEVDALGALALPEAS